MIVISFCPENECGVLGAEPLGEGVADKTAARERAAGERRSENLGARGRLPPP